MGERGSKGEEKKKELSKTTGGVGKKSGTLCGSR